MLPFRGRAGLDGLDRAVEGEGDEEGPGEVVVIAGEVEGEAGGVLPNFPVPQVLHDLPTRNVVTTIPRATELVDSVLDDQPLKRALRDAEGLRSIGYGDGVLIQ